MISFRKVLFSVFCWMIFFVPAISDHFIKHGTNYPLTILYDEADDQPVQIAVMALADDLELLTGIRPLIKTSVEEVSGEAIIIGSLAKGRYIQQLIDLNKITAENVMDLWEVYSIQSIVNPLDQIEKALVIFGSDKRGTAYGVFELSERIGVSPWHWWADVIPEKRKAVEIDQMNFVSKSPSVKYRGIFLNDECWGLNPWATNTWEPEEGNIGPRTYAAIFELLLRLRGNFIWPAMHPCTNAFYKNPENPKTADAYGIVVGSSHAEPMLRNNVDEWDHEKYGQYNFFTNRETVLNYWEERVKESSGFESIYTLGMRGIHDSGMVGAETMQERVDALHDIISQQRELLSKHVNTDPAKVPQAFTTYKEVLDIYDAGMELPEDITLVWPDDNYGYMHRYSDAEQEKRIGGSGVYYHISYWGRPHDYLWISSTHPALIWEEMIKASYFNSNEIWVVNVGDIKPLEYNTSLFLDMAWDTSCFPDGASVRKHFDRWHKNIFGDEAGQKIADVKWNYYDLNFQRRPEFMGWSQTEPTRKVHPTEFNHFQAGDEAQKRIDAFNSLTQKSAEITEMIPERLMDAYYQLVEYPLLGAAYINKKFLYMEKAYYYAAQNRIVANDYALKSKAVYDSIQFLTDYYNNEMAGGKWKNMMYMSPRSLPVFDMPAIPQWTFVTDSHWGIATEGAKDVRRVNEIKGPLYLPSFNNLLHQEFFIDVFLKEDKLLEWKAEVSNDWIVLSHSSGVLTGEKESRQQRIWVSVDWDRVPTDVRANGYIRFSGAERNYTIQIYTNRHNPSIPDKHIFVEANGYISIHAENFNRKHATESFEWGIIDGLSYTGQSVWVNPLLIKEKQFDPELNNPSVLEYDIYTTRGREVEVTIYAIPIHPINQNYGARLGVAINDEVPQIVDHQTYGRSEEWKINVLRNSAVVKTRHEISSAGHHTLKIFALDPGVIIDRITIDCGGLISTYSVLEETIVFDQ
ncbi:glycosyl hydrolase 115 family protein [Alkalitalea saponilacus]|uniref:Glycosyl hydrolase family 115 n=1 Tax=Alkalitalea saponilacus TaxID=889453 RepID=A0A1T5C869_9BACT|nr:glycosyl hydrolase 115 family protein [Alkalitalea saponilacus]ASB49767.1 hypothetical protein CDL62_11775 [Alkalitalea saponilacus]SKB55624.1 Glycosyl hydrolase family 115 [Alkalitalea saponilacus]